MQREKMRHGYSAQTLDRITTAMASRLVWALGLIVVLTHFPAISTAGPKLPQADGLVSDFAEKLSPGTRRILEDRLEDFKNRTDGVELTLVTIPYESMGGLPIEKYSLQLARSWGIGAKGKRREGLLLLIAIKPPDEQGIYHGSTRLEVSRSLQDELSNSTASGIIGLMHEDFIAGRFDQAVTTGVEHVIETIEQERGLRQPSRQTAPPAQRAQDIPAPRSGILGSLLGYVAAFFTQGGAMALFFMMLVILLVAGGFRSRAGGNPGIPFYRRSPVMWRNSADIGGDIVQQSSDSPTPPASAGDYGSTTSPDLGTSTSATDFGISSGGGDFRSSSGGGDFGGSGSTGNW
jgi:uncharacterized protein